MSEIVLRIEGLGFRVSGLGVGFRGEGVRVCGLGFGFRGYGLGLLVWAGAELGEFGNHSLGSRGV